MRGLGDCFSCLYARAGCGWVDVWATALLETLPGETWTQTWGESVWWKILVHGCLTVGLYHCGWSHSIAALHEEIHSRNIWVAQRKWNRKWWCKQEQGRQLSIHYVNLPLLEMMLNPNSRACYTNFWGRIQKIAG